MLHGNAKADWRAIVHDIEAVTLDTELLDQVINYVREIIERVIELTHTWHRTVPVARVIRRDDVIFVRERRDQIAKHVR